MAETYSGWSERYASEPKGMRAGWLNVLGAHPIFPRDVVLPIPGKKAKYNVQVDSTQSYFRTVEEHAPKEDAWVSWSPTTQYGLTGMDRVFCDIDSPDLEDALVRARRYEEWCMADFGVQPACIFTGTKGFHLHMTHDFIEGLGTSYSDAFAALIQGSGSSPDLHMLKYRKTYPRIPYAMNLKATGKNRRPTYAVPVDLTWDLKEVLQASAEIRVTPFTIPHSDALAGLLEPLVTKNLKAAERRSHMPVEAQQGMYENLVQAAIAFSEEFGWRLVNKAGQLDGRRRVLSSLYVPALMHATKGDRDQVAAAAEAFVDMSMGNWRDYKRFVESAMKECVLKDGTLRSPIGLKRFWLESSDLSVDRSRSPRKSKPTNETVDSRSSWTTSR